MIRRQERLLGERRLPPLTLHQGKLSGTETLRTDLYADLDFMDQAAANAHSNKVIMPRIVVEVKTNQPLMVAHLADLHMGHESTNHALIIEWLKWVYANGALTMLLGDLGEGFKAEYVGTNAAARVITPETESKVIQKMLKSLQQDGLLAAVVPSKEHEEWLQSQAGISHYNRRHLAGFVVTNGGEVVFDYQGGRQERFNLSHNAGGGGPDQNPLGALMNLSSKRKPANVFEAGHNHSRRGTGILINLEGERTVFIAPGSFKGLNDAIPDTLLNSSNVKPLPPGIVTIHSEKMGITPTPTREHAEVLFNAVRIWESAQHHQVLSELLEEIADKSPVQKDRPKLKLKGSDASQKRKADKKEHSNENGDENAGYQVIPHWKKLVYDFGEGQLPYQIYCLAGLRMGATTSDYDQLKNILQVAGCSNRAYLYLRRQMLDKALPKDERRMTYVKGFVKRMVPYQNKILAQLYDSVLISKAWKKDVGNCESGQKFYPASLISSGLNDLPMIDNKGSVVIKSGSHKYAIRVFDNMEGTSSRTNPYAGTVSQFNLDVRDHRPVDAYVGSTKPVAGVFQLFSQATGSHITHITPGVLAEWKGTNTNVQEAPPNGQSIIVDPVTGLVFLGSTLSHSKDLHDALMLATGLERVLTKSTKAQWIKKLGVFGNN